MRSQVTTFKFNKMLKFILKKKIIIVFVICFFLILSSVLFIKLNTPQKNSDQHSFMQIKEKLLLPKEIISLSINTRASTEFDFCVTSLKGSVEIVVTDPNNSTIFEKIYNEADWPKNYQGDSSCHLVLLHFTDIAGKYTAEITNIGTNSTFIEYSELEESVFSMNN